MVPVPGQDPSPLQALRAVRPRAVARALGSTVGVLLGIGLLALIYRTADVGRVYQKDILQDYVFARALLDRTNPYLPLTELAARYAPLATTEFPHPTPHPPPSGLLFLPFAWTSYRATVTIWLGLEVFCLVGSLLLLTRTLKPPVSLRAILAMSACLILWAPVFEELNTGQLMLLLLLLLAGARLAFLRRRPVVGGILLGLAVAIKPIPWPVILLLAYRKEWRGVAASAATVGVSYVVAAVVMGPERIASYFTVVLPEVAALYRNLAGNLSLWTLGPRVFGGTDVSASSDVFALARAAPPLVESPIAATVTAVLLPALVVVGALVLVRRHHDFDGQLGAMVCVSLLVSPTCWDSYLVLLALPISALIGWWREPGTSLGARALVAAVLIPTAVPFFVVLPAVSLLSAIVSPGSHGNLWVFGVWLLTFVPTAAVGVLGYLVVGQVQPR